MTTPSLASLSQLSARIPGGVTPAENARAQAALEDASAWIRTEAGLTWLDDDGDLDVVPDVIVSICAAVARRIFDNPDGLLQESIAQYSYSRTNATTSVYLTKQERQMIRQAVGSNSFEVIELESPYAVPWSRYDPVYATAGYGEFPDWYTPQ